MAAVVDIFALQDIRIPSALRARLGKSAKALLADGFTPEQVVTGLAQSVKRGRVDLTENLIMERQLREKGLFIESNKLTISETMSLEGESRDAAIEAVRKLLFDDPE